MPSIENRLSAIEERNARVEADKGWETSWTRRCFVVAITYICAFILLNILGHDEAWQHAFVPVMGYVISTLSLPAVKAFWIHQLSKGKT